MKKGTDLNTLQLALQLTNKDLALELPDQQLPATVESAYKQTLKVLSQQIDYLLSNQPERLMQAFYRVDVAEERVKRILAFEEGENVAESLAELVLERELQKAYFRQQYSSRQTENDSFDK